MNRFILPEAVRLMRFAAARLVFILGMSVLTHSFVFRGARIMVIVR